MGCKVTKSKVYPEPEDYKNTNQTGLVTNSSNQADRPHESTSLNQPSLAQKNEKSLTEKALKEVKEANGIGIEKTEEKVAELQLQQPQGKTNKNINDTGNENKACEKDTVDVVDISQSNNTKAEEQKNNQESAVPKHDSILENIICKSKIERQISNMDYILNKYEPGRVLGDGNYAIVKMCTLKGSTQEYAMKIVDKAMLKGKEHMIENEIEIMKQCTHSNIVKLMEEFETHSEIYLIMELVKDGDLFDAITQSVKFDEKTSAGIVNDLVQALYYLHSRSIVHRDLKPENLLVLRNTNGSITIKLADFGLAMEVKAPIFTFVGTPTYVAPEILSEIGYGLEVDMWATGVITYILLCGFPPFRSPDRNQTELFEFIKAGEYEFLSPYWDKTSRAAKDLISRLLIVEKGKRYTAIAVLCHPWVITAGGTEARSENIDTYRKNLGNELNSQAILNRESYVSAKAEKYP